MKSGLDTNPERRIAGTFLRQVNEVIPQVAPQQKNDPLVEVFRSGDLQEGFACGEDLGPDCAMGQQDPDDDVQAVPLLGGILPQEFPAHGERVEDAAHGNGGPLGAACGLVFEDAAALHDDARPRHVAAAPRGHLDAADGCDARQRLPPEAEGFYIVEIFDGEDLARGMPLKGKGDFARRDARPVVGDPDQLLAATAQFDRDVRGARIEGIFQELLHDGRGPFDDFAGGDLRGDLFGKYGDPSVQIHNLTYKVTALRGKGQKKKIFPHPNPEP